MRRPLANTGREIRAMLNKAGQPEDFDVAMAPKGIVGLMDHELAFILGDEITTGTTAGYWSFRKEWNCYHGSVFVVTYRNPKTAGKDY